VLLLGKREVLGPSRAIEEANRSGETRSAITDGNFATVLPDKVGVAAERGVANNVASRSSGMSTVASGERGEVAGGVGNVAGGASTGEEDLAVDA